MMSMIHDPTDNLFSWSNFVINNQSFQYSNPTGQRMGLQTTYYLKVTKYKNGSTYISYDTIHNISGFHYQVVW